MYEDIRESSPRAIYFFGEARSLTFLLSAEPFLEYFRGWRNRANRKAPQDLSDSSLSAVYRLRRPLEKKNHLRGPVILFFSCHAYSISESTRRAIFHLYSPSNAAADSA